MITANLDLNHEVLRCRAWLREEVLRCRAWLRDTAILAKDEQFSGRLKHDAVEPFARAAGHLQQAQDAAGRQKD
jgi:hypothetical protein